MACTYCTKCDISTQNSFNPLLGDGNLDAKIMFIGRNPTYKDRKVNVPLMSKAGEHFQLYLDMFNFKRDNIFITDSVKCKTPNDRFVSDTEIQNCRSILEEELNEVKPQIIVLLGTTAIRSYFNLTGITIPINIHKLQGKHIIHKNRIIIFSFHPSYVYKNKAYRIEMYKVFIKLLNIIRVTNPFHRTNIGI